MATTTRDRNAFRAFVRHAGTSGHLMDTDMMRSLRLVNRNTQAQLRPYAVIALDDSGNVTDTMSIIHANAAPVVTWIFSKHPDAGSIAPQLPVLPSIPVVRLRMTVRGMNVGTLDSMVQGYNLGISRWGSVSHDRLVLPPMRVRGRKRAANGMAIPSTPRGSCYRIVDHIGSLELSIDMYNVSAVREHLTSLAFLAMAPGVLTSSISVTSAGHPDGFVVRLL